jgi:hypothetical protein
MVKRFELGEIAVTRKANKMLDLQSVVKALGRYINGDWGDVSEHDLKANNEALDNLECGGRLFAKYKDADNVKFWIITDFSVNRTTLLLPEDY